MHETKLRIDLIIPLLALLAVVLLFFLPVPTFVKIIIGLLIVFLGRFASASYGNQGRK